MKGRGRGGTLALAACSSQIAITSLLHMSILEQFHSAGQAAQLRASRARSRALTRDLCGEQLFGPRLPVVNPVLWELGHVAWFQEGWCLRWRDDGTLANSMLPGADGLYDSAAIADRKSTCLNSSHANISYAVFCLKKNK